MVGSGLMEWTVVADGIPQGKLWLVMLCFAVSLVLSWVLMALQMRRVDSLELEVLHLRRIVRQQRGGTAISMDLHR